MSDNQKPINMEELLDGIPLPAGKLEIIDYADEHGASKEALNLIQALPAEEYVSMQDINAALGELEKQPGSDNLWASN